jgi:hypothetical protein
MPDGAKAPEAIDFQGKQAPVTGATKARGWRLSNVLFGGEGGTAELQQRLSKQSTPLWVRVFLRSKPD